MLFTITVALLALWALGLLTGITLGGFIHLFPAAAIIMVLAGFFASRLNEDVTEE